MSDEWGSPEPQKTGDSPEAGASFFQNALYRYSRRPAAVVSFFAAAFLILIAVFGPLVYRRSYSEQNLNHINTPPFLRVYPVSGEFFYLSSNLKLIGVSPRGELLAPLERLGDDQSAKRITYRAGGRNYFIDYSHNPPFLADESGPLSSRRILNRLYPLGSDSLGRDILIRLLYGSRISLTVAFVATLVNLMIGVFYGGASGYIGGSFGAILMRGVDILSAIPLTLYVILIMVVFEGDGFISIILALGLVYWMDMARVVRAQILSLKERDFIIAARTMGSGPWYILRRHLIVNSVGPIMVTATMQVPAAIFTEAFMSFIGLGVTAPMASWGTMCNDALESLRTAPYQLAFPAAAICLTMFAFNFIGDGLRDAFDPRMEQT
ncbi:MAG: ABC transporter permease [Spirochaetales bacterium]|jgi:oligopeptide transport system permease protein|nr:ABC transporter permease [Spirochaetales bacterium]